MTDPDGSWMIRHADFSICVITVLTYIPKPRTADFAPPAVIFWACRRNAVRLDSMPDFPRPADLADALAGASRQ
jgi:hypothetical protein